VTNDLEQLLAAEPDGWPEDASRDRLVGDWSLWQRRRGHRTSTDDVLTAWLAARDGIRPSRYLDLGCGIGSVMLLTAHRLRPNETIGVEAQAQSVAMARRTVAELPDPPPIRVVRDDLRNVTADRFGHFDLVTGSPPYLPLGTGVLSPDAQRRACRFELRGGVEAYCAAARRVLTPHGRFSLVFQTTWTERVLAAAAAADLMLHAVVDVTTREGNEDPFLSVFAFGRIAPDAVAREHRIVRDAQGGVHPTWQAVRDDLGLDTRL
jgi:tRNA1(Val) A37 N6-methylase TrmN6